MALLNISSLLQSRRALLAVAAVVPLVGAAIAVPALMSGDPDPVSPAPVAAAAPAPSATLPAPDDVSDGDAGAETAQAEPAAENGPHAGGDLDIGLGLRFERYPAGAAIRATVEIANNSLEPVFLPAPSEPQSTLVILVLDDEGRTVRRVVEQTADTTPRRMRRLGSGDTAKMRIDVVTRDEEALAPGTYHLVASYDTDDGWRRSGLDVWAAPQGVRRSDRVSFEVIASK